MSWRYACDLDGEPAGWSDEEFRTERAALAEGRARFDGPVWVAWVEVKDYAAQLPSAQQLLVAAKETAAEAGVDTACFDALEPGDIAVLDDLLRKTTQNWEQWLPEGKRSTVVVVQNQRRFDPDGL